MFDLALFLFFPIYLFLDFQVNPLVNNMVNQERGDVNYSDLGGLSKQIRDLRDCIESPLKDPEIFKRVGVKPPKV